MNSKTQQNTQKYLQQHSHAIDLDFCHDLIVQRQPWRYVIIIPACGESADFTAQVFKNILHHSVLLVLIVNRPDEHLKSAQWQEQNKQLIDQLKRQAKQIIASKDKHCLLLNESKVDCLLLDYNHQPFSKKQGVGLARKIAADTALNLIGKGVISQPWIFSTDADVELPVGYFESVEHLSTDYSAVSLDFNHIGKDEKLLMLQSQYDFKLRYYQQGIRHIETCYHYIPLGSTLIVQAHAYVQVRGFPCKSGGEDFYILNKLAKVGRIYQPKKPIVNINIRYSDRVPFGTGPALIKLSETVSKPRYYHPSIFHVIKDWRQALIDYFSNGSIPVNDFGLNEYWDIETLLLKVRQQYKSPELWLKFIDDWFDAFKILKSVHFLELTYQGVKGSELEKMDEYLEVVTDKANN